MATYDDEVDAVFHALADPTRRGMLGRLAEESCSVGELAAPYPMSLAAASKHVGVLERAGLLRRRVQGRHHICQLEPARLAGAAAWIRAYERFWAASLDDLDAMFRAEAGERPDAEHT